MLSALFPCFEVCVGGAGVTMPTTIHSTSALDLSLLKMMKGNQMFLQATIYSFTSL